MLTILHHRRQPTADHLTRARRADASVPAGGDGWPFGSPPDLAGTLARQADDLAAMIEACSSIDALTSRIVLDSLGQMHVLADELAALLTGDLR